VDVFDSVLKNARLLYEAEAQAASDRMQAYAERKGLESLHKITIEQVEAYIDTQIDPDTMTAAEMAVGIKKVLKKLAVYTLMMHS